MMVPIQNLKGGAQQLMQEMTLMQEKKLLLVLPLTG
jgi:hypothetical protein